MIDFIKDQIQASYTIKQAILADGGLIGLIKEVALKTVAVYTGGHKVLLAGNGGSAADAQHLAGELVNRLYFDRPGLPAIALTTDTSVLTAIGNDSSFDEIFARQIQAIGVSGDLFIGISTSGNSPNIVNAFHECKTKGVITVGLTGQGPNRVAEIADYCIQVPATETPRVQECHILIGHIICAVVERAIFQNGFRDDSRSGF
jgi:D-sedoheptulose 7-phosphate isomerase